MKVDFSKPRKTALKISNKKFRDLLTRIADLLEFKIATFQKISVAFVSLNKIAKINEKFLGHKGITDVISFDYRNSVDSLCDDHEIIAEIIVSHEKAFLEVQKRKNITFAEELALYIVHGMLHIYGLDDLTPADRREMRVAEKRVMFSLKNEFDFYKIFRFNFDKGEQHQFAVYAKSN